MWGLAPKYEEGQMRGNDFLQALVRDSVQMIESRVHRAESIWFTDSALPKIAVSSSSSLYVQILLTMCFGFRYEKKKWFICISDSWVLSYDSDVLLIVLRLLFYNIF